MLWVCFEPERDVSRKILIIEDDKDIAMMLATVLRLAGYEVRHAPDAVVAITVATNEAPDAILLDLMLPGGGGLKVLERLRSMIPTGLIPVIVVTASGVANKEESLRAGAQAFLNKPVDPDELLATLTEILGETPATRS